VNRILVDANVLISFITDRNLQQQEQADDLFKAAAGGYEAVATFDRPLRKKLAKLGAQSYWAD
jgi:rRNA-processing protein FCF1